MDALCGALRCNDCLQDMSLRGNAVTDKGVGVLLLALGFNTALISMDLGGTRCNQRALELLTELIIVKRDP